MSWLGVKYALACRDERVKGGTRLVLVVLGARVDYRRITTCPTSLGELRWLTFMSVEQLRRILDDLEAWCLVRRLSRGKNAVYALPKMAGPLFAVDDGDPVKMTDFVIDGLPKEIGQDARKVTGRMTGFRRRMTDFSGRRAGGVLFSEVQSTEVPTTTAKSEQEQQVDLLLEWWDYAFRLYNPGATPTLTADSRAIAADLLTERARGRLQLMATAMWQVNARADAFIARSDRGLRVLRHKAQWLDQFVSHMPAWWRECRHEPKCECERDCRAQSTEQVS